MVGHVRLNLLEVRNSLRFHFFCPHLVAMEELSGEYLLFIVDNELGKSSTALVKLTIRGDICVYRV